MDKQEKGATTRSEILSQPQVWGRALGDLEAYRKAFDTHEFGA